MMGDKFQKKNALRYGLPRLQQASTKIGFLSVLAGSLAALFGASPELADLVGGTAGHVVGGLLIGAGAHAAVVDDGSA